MTGHFLWFLLRATHNRVRRQLRRLRTPRYAVAALGGVAYFYLIFGRWTVGDAADHAMGQTYLAAARGIGPLFLGLLAAWWWLWGGHRTALALTPAETHLLVPAPLARRELVRFRILQAQVPIVFSAGIGVIVTQGSLLPWPARFLSLWVLLATLHQHQIAASLVHAAADEQGRRGLRRQAVPLAIFGAALLAVGAALTRAVREIRAAADFEFAVARLGGLMQEPAPRIALAPFRLLLEPLTAVSLQAWATPFLVALLVLAAHYVWVQRTDAAFEEAAAAQGERRAARRATQHDGRLRRRSPGRRRVSRPLLPLDVSAPPAWALLWKNVLYSQRVIRPAAVIVVLLGATALFAPTLLTSQSPDQAFRRMGAVLLGFGALATLTGPLMVRNDLRMDLLHVDALRTYPLRGRDIVAAEITAAALVIATLQLPLVLGGLVALALGGALSPLTAAGAMVVALLALPAIDALGVTIQNAIALLYPGWARIGEQESGGMEAVGQNLITLIGTVLLLGVTTIPPLLAGAAVGAPLMLLQPSLAIAAGAVTVAVAMAGEVFLLVRWLGGLFERTDPVAAGLLR